MANFLTYNGSYCLHEGHIGCGSIQDLKNKMVGNIAGNSDSGCTILFDEIIREFDSPRILLIVRDRQEVESSMDEVGLFWEGTNLLFDHLAVEIKRISETPGVMVCKYEDIDDRIEEIWNFCTGLPFDKRRADTIHGLHVVVDVMESIIKSQNNYSVTKELFKDKFL